MESFILNIEWSLATCYVSRGVGEGGQGTIAPPLGWHNPLTFVQFIPYFY